MIQDQHLGKVKGNKEGYCLVCDSKEIAFTSLGASFCEECWKALRDENELSKRIVW